MRKSLIVLIAALIAALPVAAYAAYSIVLTLTMSKEVLQFNTLEASVAKAELYRYDTGIRFKVVDPQTNYVAVRFLVRVDGVELTNSTQLGLEIDDKDLIYVASGTGKRVSDNEFVVDVAFSCLHNKDFAIVLTLTNIGEISDNAKITIEIQDIAASTKGS